MVVCVYAVVACVCLGGGPCMHALYRCTRVARDDFFGKIKTMNQIPNPFGTMTHRMTGVVRFVAWQP